MLREQGADFSGDEMSAVEEKLAELKTALEGDDLDAIKAGQEALSAVSQSFAQKLYEQAAAQQADATSESDGAADDDVVDAEIVEEDDEK